MAKDKPLSKSDILNALAESTQLSRKEVGAVMDALEGLIERASPRDAAFSIFLG
ncbi:MAG: HU family DNA-binding protein [Planctomycetaceae bacterium]